jgi:hypothetical protein
VAGDSVPNQFNWLDHDELGQLLADRKAGIANLADEIGLAGEEPDDLVFAKAEFTEAVLEFRRGAKLLDPDSHAGFDLGERTNFATGLFRARFNCFQPIHNQLVRICRLRRILTTHFLARGDHFLRGEAG